jgi:hypothetical protein
MVAAETGRVHFYFRGESGACARRYWIIYRAIPDPRKHNGESLGWSIMTIYRTIN